MKNTTSEIVVNLAEKLQISDEWNGYPEIFSLSRPLEIFWQYLLLRTVFFFKEKTLLGVPV